MNKIKQACAFTNLLKSISYEIKEFFARLLFSNKPVQLPVLTCIDITDCRRKTRWHCHVAYTMLHLACQVTSQIECESKNIYKWIHK